MKELKIFSGFLLLSLLMSCASTTANFDFNNEGNVAPSDIKFVNASKKATSYTWDFGDGQQSTEESPTHTYSHSGRYEIVLTAKQGSKTSKMTKEIILDAPSECLVKMTTTAGDLVFRLSDATPKHRDNFVKLAKSNYYEGVLFHRVINNFMVQGGDPDSKNAEKGKALGVGGPGYVIDGEFIDSLVHIKGALAAARQGDAVNPLKQSSGSQFYIVHGNDVSSSMLDRTENQKSIIYSDEIKEKYIANGGTPFLDKEYSVFGNLIEGFDVLEAIANEATDQRDRPIEDIKILSVTVIK